MKKISKKITLEEKILIKERVINKKISKKTLEEIAGWTSLRRVWCVMREDLE